MVSVWLALFILAGTFSGSGCARAQDRPANDADRMDGPPASSTSWAYIARWDAQVGPSSARREETWIAAPDGAAWRALHDNQVDRHARSNAFSDELLTHLIMTSRQSPPLYRERGSRLTHVDGPIGEYWIVVVGEDGGFARWADEAAYFDPALLAASAAVLKAASDTAASSATEEGPWLQVLPLEDAQADALERGGYLVMLGEQDLEQHPQLAAAIARPYSWHPLAHDDLALSPQNRLSRENPALPAAYGGQRLQLMLQFISHTDEIENSSYTVPPG